MSLLGRRVECEALDGIVRDVAAGASRVLVIRGEPGIGKSALLGYLTEQVQQWHVASAVGVESEMELAYSGLHQLCAPYLGRLGALPPPQREALQTVFGLNVGPPPSQFLVGLATLTLLADLSERRPVACIVDDGQWLDQATAQLLGFVGRRLLAEPIAIVCAIRTDVGDTVLTGLPEIRLNGLDDEDSRSLLVGSVHGRLDAAVSERIITESHGNPLALLELPRTWTATDLAGGFGLPESQRVASKIEQSYTRRFQALPLDAQLLALTASAETLGDPALLARAARGLDLDMRSAIPAQDAGLMRIRGRVEFTHPLARSAIYGEATADDRHRVHRALADATDARTDPDRRAWHLARGTAGPDDHVADELERSAGRAGARGGFAAAAAFLGRATELTADPVDRVRRALDAAFGNVQAGSFDTARRLLGIARRGPVDEAQQARIDLLLAQLALESSRGNDVAPLLVAAARRLETLNPDLAQQTYLDAVTAALFGARLNEGIDVVSVEEAARAAPRQTREEPNAADLLLDAFSALTVDYRTAVAPCRAAIRKLGSDNTTSTEKLRWLWHGTVLAYELWDDEAAEVLSGIHVATARERGALSELALALSSRTPALVFSGDHDAAAAAVAEAEGVQQATGIRAAPYGALIFSAWHGADGRRTKDLIQIAIREARSRGEGIGVTVSEYAHAVLCNGLGEYEEAMVAALRAVEDPAELVAHSWGLTELVEAAVRTGHVDVAADAMRRIERKSRSSATDWALGIEARSRALLSREPDAEELYQEAIERLTRTRVRAELARAHLVYGEWLRRTRRRADARGELDIAFEMFTAMGAVAFAEQARRELLATGATVRKRSAEARDELTAQELQIARLARDGHSNPEIGAQLFISARTVEWHLSNVFGKLDITSRRQLRQRLPERTSDRV